MRLSPTGTWRSNAVMWAIHAPLISRQKSMKGTALHEDASRGGNPPKVHAIWSTLDRFTAYYAAQGRTVPHFDERIRCYRYLIILDSMRFWALVGKEEEYIAMREKILPTLW